MRSSNHRYRLKLVMPSYDGIRLHVHIFPDPVMRRGDKTRFFASKARTRNDESKGAVVLRAFYAFVLTLALAPQNAHAGAWTQAAGHSQLIVNTLFYETQEAFDAEGERHPSAQFSKWEVNPYYEYGLSDAWTVGSSLFLHTLKQENAALSQTESNSGSSGAEFFARRALYERDGMVLSLQPLLKTPGAYLHPGSPRAGTEAWDGELSLLGGYGFDLWGQHHYLDLGVGYRRRGGGLEDQLRLNAALGAGITPSWKILAELHSDRRMGAGAGTPLSLSGQNNYDLLRGQISALYALSERYSLQLGAFRHLAGEDTGAGGGVMLALWTTW